MLYILYECHESGYSIFLLQRAVKYLSFQLKSFDMNPTPPRKLSCASGIY